MIEMLSNNTLVARKEYCCDASDWLLNEGINGFGFSFAELREIVIARRNGWKIKKGEKYIRQRGKYDGDLYTFKAIPAIHKICLKYNLYEA